MGPQYTSSVVAPWPVTVIPVGTLQYAKSPFDLLAMVEIAWLHSAVGEGEVRGSRSSVEASQKKQVLL